MRRHLTAFAALAVAGGMLLTPGTANAAAPQAAAQGTAAQADQPLSPLKTDIFAPRVTWPGDPIVYTLKIKNVGKWYTDIAYVGGYLPKQVSKVRIISKPKGAYCEVTGREVGCLLDTLNPGKSTTLKIRAWVNRNARGTAVAEFGSASIDIPAGGLGTFDIHGIDVGTDIKYGRVKTKIIR